jgi:hypothetical protein
MVKLLHGSHDITAIDAKTGDVVGTVKAEGDGEQAAIGTEEMFAGHATRFRGRTKCDCIGRMRSLPLM